MFSRDIYLNPILDNAPRILGFLNRNISSSSYGCFDREFWHYNTTDIACARKQEAVLTLTLLYLIENKCNKYYRSSEILEYIKASMHFWLQIQNNNGSFNEWYPNEHSFVVTAFSTYAVSESLLLLKEEVYQGEKDVVIKGLVRAADWLLTRHETRVMNQQTGAAIALFNLYLLTDRSEYLDASKDKIDILSKGQSKEGWFIEYGGPDIGYLSLAIDYLSKYLQKTGDPIVRDMVSHSVAFIKYFVQPNMIAGGEYTSRNTEYLIPHGFEMLSKENEDAAFISSIIRKSLLTHNTCPQILDDRYLTYNAYTWLQAYMDSNSTLDDTAERRIEEFFAKPDKKYFEESGLLVVNDNSKHLIVNVKKGGAFRLYDKVSERTYSDSGILVKSGSKWYTAGWLAETVNSISDDTVKVSGSLWCVPDKTMTSLRYVALRLFQVTFGRSSIISLWIKERLRDMLITKANPSSMKYNREIIVPSEPEAILYIRDSVSSNSSAISSVAVFAKDTHIYVPSSRYYSGTKEKPLKKDFPSHVKDICINWNIDRKSGIRILES